MQYFQHSSLSLQVQGCETSSSRYLLIESGYLGRFWITVAQRPTETSKRQTLLRSSHWNTTEENFKGQEDWEGAKSFHKRRTSWPKLKTTNEFLRKEFEESDDGLETTEKCVACDVGLSGWLLIWHLLRDGLAFCNLLY